MAPILVYYTLSLVSGNREYPPLLSAQAPSLCFDQCRLPGAHTIHTPSVRRLSVPPSFIRQAYERASKLLDSGSYDAGTLPVLARAAYLSGGLPPRLFRASLSREIHRWALQQLGQSQREALRWGVVPQCGAPTPAPSTANGSQPGLPLMSSSSYSAADGGSLNSIRPLSPARAHLGQNLAVLMHAVHKLELYAACPELPALLVQLSAREAPRCSLESLTLFLAPATKVCVYAGGEGVGRVYDGALIPA